MEILFMGTGTSQGVPMIAHDSEGCDLSDPRNWRTRSSMHFVLEQTHIQVDACPEFRMQCLRNDIRTIDHFILTHGHADHIMGMDDLRRFCDQIGGAIPVCASEEGLARIAAVYPYAMRDTPARKGYAAFKASLMPPCMELPGGRVFSTPLPHGAIETLGLVFEESATGRKCVYYNDCKSVPEEAMQLAEGADVVILDGLRPEPHPTHMSIGEAVEVAQRIGAPQTYLTHLTFYVDHATWQKKLPEGIFLAWDGLRLTL